MSYFLSHIFQERSNAAVIDALLGLGAIIPPGKSFRMTKEVRERRETTLKEKLKNESDQEPLSRLDLLRQKSEF